MMIDNGDGVRLFALAGACCNTNCANGIRRATEMLGR